MPRKRGVCRSVDLVVDPLSLDIGEDPPVSSRYSRQTDAKTDDTSFNGGICQDVLVKNTDQAVRGPSG